VDNNYVVIPALNTTLHKRLYYRPLVKQLVFKWGDGGANGPNESMKYTFVLGQDQLIHVLQAAMDLMGKEELLKCLPTQ